MHAVLSVYISTCVCAIILVFSHAYTGCKVPNCAICDTIDTCKECLSFYELSDNICSKSCYAGCFDIQDIHMYKHTHSHTHSFMYTHTHTTPHHTHTRTHTFTECPVKGCDVCDKDGTKCDQCENNGRFDESQSACITGGDDEGDDEGDGGLSPGAIAG